MSGEGLDVTEQAVTTAQAILRRALLTVSPYRGKSLSDISGWPAILLPQHKDTLAARELSRQFDSAVDRMAEVLDRIRIGDFPELDDRDVDDVYEQFVHLLADPEFPIELENIVDKTPISELTSRVLRFLGSGWYKEAFSSNIREFGSQLAMIVCWALARWVDVLHPKNDEAAWVHLTGSTLFVEETRKLLNEFVRTKVSGFGDAKIVESQRRDLTSALGRMELFGLPVEDRFRWVPIEIGYLSGKVTDGKRVADSRNTLPDVLESLLAATHSTALCAASGNAPTPYSKPPTRTSAATAAAPGASATSPPLPWSCFTTNTAEPHDQTEVDHTQPPDVTRKGSVPIGVGL